jgi:hypothetical protein
MTITMLLVNTVVSAERALAKSRAERARAAGPAPRLAFINIRTQHTNE